MPIKSFQQFKTDDEFGCERNIVMRKVKKENKQLYGIIGMGRFGLALAQSLSETGAEIIAIDTNADKVKTALRFTDNAFTITDSTKDILTECGIKNCDTVIVCIGEAIDTSILTTLNVIELGVKKVIAKASSNEHGAVLEKLGAEVVYPEKDRAVVLAKKLTSSKIMEYITLNGEIDIAEIELSNIPEGMTVMNMGFRNKYKLNVIAIKHDDKIITEIGPDTPVATGDTAVVCGKRSNITKLEANI